MLNTSMVPEPLIWNLLINGYGRCGDVKKAYELRDQMAAFGLTPNIFTYNALIHALLKSGNIIDALRLKQKMQMLDDEFSPDVVTYNLFIIGSCHIGKPFVVFNEMRSRGLQPDVITYTVLIQYLCNKGEVKEAEEVFAQMQKAVSFIDHVPYQILIKFYCRIGKLRKAFDLHEIMLEKGLVGRPSMYFYLLSVLKRASVEVVLLLGHHDVFMLPAIFCWKRSQDYYSLENPLWKIRVPFSSVSFTSTQKQHCENDVCFYQKRRECDHQVHCETSKPNNRLIFREGIYSVKSSRRGGPEGAPGAIINWSNCAPNLG